MANYVANTVAKHVLKEGAQNHFGSDDPYFEYVAPTDANGRVTGKPKKQRRPVPPGLTKQEEKILKKVTRRAHRLDNCFNVCGIRVGWSAIIGLLPFAGDGVDAFMALMVVWTCMQAKIPDALKSRMMLNIALDFAIGLFPILGDIADAFYRCNTRNAALLYKHLEARGAARLRDQAAGGRPESRRDRSQTRPSPHRNPSSNRAEVKPAAPRPTPQNTREFNEKSSAPGRSQAPRPVTAEDLKRLPQAKLGNSKKSDGTGWLSRLTSSRQPQPDLEHDGNDMREVQRR